MEIVILILIGILVGIFVISMGGGGGAIYLGILTALFHLPAATAATTSLITAIPSLLLGAYAYYRQGKIDFKIGNKMLIAALPAVIIGSLLAPLIPKMVYTIVIGLILILLGIQIFLKTRQSNSSKDTTHDNNFKAIGYGFLSGLMVGIAGLSGGGPIVAGLLLMGLDMINAAATSAYVLIGTSIVGALLHVSNGQVDWTAGIGLMIGALIGAFIAPYLMTKFKHSSIWLPPIMAVLLIVMGIKTII
ncbi:MAG: sulfite exporter TauE/SafE family protein [Liquorilactobacillus ghanensis]|uniref:sulfite exporter TauE/SafE family protein n=1 Tax=Liquorilactobacillus ghanensis TaxID=399370 RepID=UPI0039EBD13D